MKPLIFDRTNQDIIDRTPKGYFNVEDINRIEEWSRYIADLLNSYGYEINISTKTDWEISDFLNISQMERVRSNVKKIRDVYYSLETTPTIPTTLNKFNYIKANEIERILYDIENAVAYSKLYFVRSGVGNTGQSRLWQFRFRQDKLWNTLQKEYWTDFKKEETWEVVE